MLGSNARGVAIPGDNHNVVVRHNIDVVRILRNMGVESAPSPILHDYHWPGMYRPYDHQKVMADAMTVHPRIFNLSEMGTGKTYAALWAADYLMQIGAVKRVAVLCPLSTTDDIWKKDVFKILLHRNCAIVHGSKEKRTKALNMDVDFYIINHHGIERRDVCKELKRRKDIDLIILDEASVFRNHRTNAYRFLNWVLEAKEKRFWCMTGTPCPTEPADAWALARMISPHLVPEHKGEFWRQTMVTPEGSTKAYPRKGYEQIVYDAMQPAVRFRKKDCLQLPTLTVQDRKSVLSAAQVKAFNSMQLTMQASISNGQSLNAVHAADQLMKLRQILCGAAFDPLTGNYNPIDHTERLQDLVDCINEASAKVIVITPFKGIQRVLDMELRALGYTVGMINGDISQSVRTKIIDAFKTTADPHILLCHPQVMAHGLNLTEADYLIFYAPIYSYDQYAQVVERFNRAGQTRKMTVIRMHAHPVEQSIYRVLDKRGAVQQNILDLYGEVTLAKAA